MLENDQLREQLETTKREMQSLVHSNFKHFDITKPNKGENGEAADFGQASQGEIMELKNRAHLLSEENNSLLQQIGVLRSHYDTFNKDHSQKVEEANKRLQGLDKLNNDLQSLLLQRDNLSRTSQALDQKLKNTTLKLAATEEGRKQD